MKCTTPDGLEIHELHGVGLVVSASKHNREIARCNETLRAIEAVNVNEFGHTADEAIKRLIDSHFANGSHEPRAK